MKKLVGPVSEEAFKCSAASKTTLRPNSFRLNTLCLIASAEQWYSCPNANADGVYANEGPSGFFWWGLVRMQLKSKYGIEYNKSLKPTAYAAA